VPIVTLSIIDKILSIVLLLLEAEPPEIRRARLVMLYFWAKPLFIWRVPQEYRQAIEDLVAGLKAIDETP